LNFQGYRRPEGSVGIRNHTLILPTVICACETASRIAARVKGTVTFTHQHGCAQIQDEHGTRRTIEKGAAIAKRMVKRAIKMEREPCNVSELVVGLECGGSDVTSGIAANPALGAASDMIIKEGGTTILSETTELIGAEHIIAKRASTPRVEERIYEIVKRMEQKIKATGADFISGQPTPGNIKGGLTTIEEKSLGCIFKAGTVQVKEVLEYGEKPDERGLVIMDTPGQDVESITGMIAGGAQLIAFTTGQGTPVGSAIAPVIKITGNPRTYRTMRENIDINAGTIIDGKETIEQVGKKIFNEIIRVASGKRTKAESLGYHEFAINRIGPTL